MILFVIFNCSGFSHRAHLLCFITAFVIMCFTVIFHRYGGPFVIWTCTGVQGKFYANETGSSPHHLAQAVFLLTVPRRFLCYSPLCVGGFVNGVFVIMSITKTCLYSFDPFKHHFYIVKLGFTGVCIIFLIFAQNHRLWEVVRTVSPRRF